MIWPFVPLEWLARISGGSTPKRNKAAYWDGDIPWLTPSDLPGPGATIVNVRDTADHITQEGLRSCSAPLLPLGTVLFSSRATIGKIGIIEVPLATNQGFANFTPSPCIEPRYLAYALRFFTPQIVALAGSTTFKEVSRGAIRKFKIPLPPTSEQRRIIEILDQADALQRERAEAEEKARRILSAIFKKMFGADLQRENCKTLGEIAHDFRYGTSTRSEDQGYPTLRIPNVVGGRLNLEKIKFVPVNRKEFERLRLKTGDMLVVRTNGNPDYVGRSVVFEEQAVRDTGLRTEQFIYASYLIRIRINSDIAEPWFIQNYLSLTEGRRALRERCRTSAGQYNINVNALSSIPVPDVSIERQREFVEHVQIIRESNLQRLELSRHLDCASSSLLHRAFSGELTARWREQCADELSRQAEEQAEALERGYPADPISPRRGRPRRVASC